MLTDFQNSFTIGLSSKHVMKWSLKTHHTSYTSLYYLVKCKYQETSDKLKEMSHLIINFNLILTIILIFVTVNIHNILLWLNAGMEMPTPMVNEILNNAFPLQPMHQSDVASNPSRPGRLVRFSATTLSCAALGKLFTHVPLSSSSINLVPLQAWKVAVGLASHWPCISDNSGFTTYWLTALERKMSTPPMLRTD